MAEVLSIYISSFWAWAGITIGGGIVLHELAKLIVGSLGALRGTPVHIGDINNETKVVQPEQDWEYQ